MQWTRKPQEHEGTYHFSGQFYITPKILDKLKPNEITAIYRDIQNFVKKHNGADYLQVYENGEGDKLYFIDQLNTAMIESTEYTAEDNYCTLMFSSEY